VTAAPFFRITHLGICVADLDRSRAFYRDALGMDEVATLRVAGEPTQTLLDVDDLDLELVYLERDGIRIELLHYHGPGTAVDAARPMNQVGFTHLSLRVPELDSLVEAIRSAGGSVDDETLVRFVGGNRGVMAHDPDGTRLELIEDVTR
jgi:catechol 2,3-dioxygenase-like lactoylglutathione lyase family enzyme